LIEGVDPRTKQPVSGDSALNQPDVLRALLTAHTALETVMARDARRAQLPDNVGRPWSNDEEQQLITAFKEKMSIADIANLHSRTMRAIEARLERLGADYGGAAHDDGRLRQPASQEKGGQRQC
jgi:hypothetical protein